MKGEPLDTDNFLAKWLAGEISDAELANLVSEDDFKAYLAIRKMTRSIDIEAPDLAGDFEKVKAKLSQEHDQKESRVLPIARYVAIAAALVMMFGLYNLFVFSNEVTVQNGKSYTFDPGDGSQITANAMTQICYPPWFSMNRSLKLSGEAYFDVKSGSGFSVQTDLGEVKVLGTQFNVINRDGLFEVTCFEGRVAVTGKFASVILTPGESFRIYKGMSESWREDIVRPQWLSGESAFRKMPLEIVIRQFENQYNTKVDFPTEIASARFTGSFVHGNLETALKSICYPLELKYKINGNHVTISQ